MVTIVSRECVLLVVFVAFCRRRTHLVRCPLDGGSGNVLQPSKLYLARHDSSILSCGRDVEAESTLLVHRAHCEWHFPFR